MTKLIVENYKVQRTVSDGGHNYILTEIYYKGNRRRLVILFSDKTEEPTLNEKKPLKLIGDIDDEGIEFDLMMYNACMEK
ncbi:hypothetical protein [Winogradskyella sp. MIT101101]|uniref:hypothetical protein n=1 Tax=Winogradskyella sp. MIT101101 TaxID=3098297 RepID=UPI00399A9DEC